MKNTVPSFKKFSTPTKEVMNEEQMFYMFSKNLITIQKRVEEMLAMDKAVVDRILQDGHDWASDHIATSKDDIEEVANFLMARMKGVDESVDSLNESGTIKIGNAISPDLTNFLTTVVVPKSKGYVRNERDAAALLLDIIKHRYNF